MMIRFPYLFIPALLLALVLSCDTGLQGNLNENIPPGTFLTVDEINLNQDDDQEQERRLVSQVHISWWGDDPDGYVVGYEFAITERDWQYSPETEHQAEWIYTENTDSVFVLPIPPGEKFADIRFTVRAVDNLGARDPKGASVVFPIENSPPNIELHKFLTAQRDKEVPPDTTFHIVSFGWTATDPDGDANLSHIEVVMNDTLAQWVRVPVNVNFLSFRIDDHDGNRGSASVFLGRSFASSGITLENIRLNETNTFYIRAVDNAEAVSSIDSFSWHIKQQTSNVLFINDFPGSLGAEALIFHQELLKALGISQYDYLQITDGVAAGGQKVPLSAAFHRPVDPTLNRILAEWDHIYWISGDLDRNISYALRSTIDFFQNGGTMFINIPTKRLPDEDPIFQFLPVNKMKPVPVGQTSYQVPANAELVPAQSQTLDTLVIRRGSQSVFPLEPVGNARLLYDVTFLTRPFFTQVPGTIAVGTPDASIIYFGYPMDWIRMDDSLIRSAGNLLLELNFPVNIPQ